MSCAGYKPGTAGLKEKKPGVDKIEGKRFKLARFSPTFNIEGLTSNRPKLITKLMKQQD